MKIQATTPAGEPQRFKLGPFEGPVPAGGAWVLMVLVVAAVLVVGWVYVRDHILTDDRNAVRIKAAELLQLNESARHFSEPPEKSIELFKDARGEISIQYFPSDKCLLVRRVPPDPRAPILNQFIVDPAREASSPPPRFSAVRGELALEGTAWADGVCLNPHPGPFTQTLGQRSPDGCWVQVWRSWPDGCTHWQAFNSCNNTWGPINWTRCVH